ncbi:MAG: hypothetical protein QOG34_2594 [Frankiaceae bacterium]|nr:hypothetical protein [Frankiaceae bacterium]
MRRHLPLLAVAGAAAIAVPVVAHATATNAVRTSAQTFLNAGGEPNITVSPSGKYVLADGLGSESPATLYRSTDYGKHFTLTVPQVSQAGGGDWDMHFVDEKTVVAADLDLGVGIHVDVSRDAGATWSESTISMDVYDRPWIGAKGNNLYLVAKGFDAVPYLYSSHDLGKTFDPLPIPLYGTGPLPAEAGGTSPTPVEALVTNQNAYVDNLTVDPKTGDVFVLYGIDPPESYPSNPPLGAPSRLYVAHLENGSMISHPVTPGGGTAADAFYAGFNWMTEDAAGTLYVVGNGKHSNGQGSHQAPWLSYSKDKGKTWSTLVDIGTPGRTSVYGAITGGTKGNVGLVYYEGTGSDANTAQNWYATMAWVTKADTGKPNVLRERVVAKPVHNADICLDGILCGAPGFGNNRNLLDYIDNTIGPDGKMWAVFASDGPATGVADSGANNARTSTILVKQVNGPSLGKGVVGT